jgi:hypothetical protein
MEEVVHLLRGERLARKLSVNLHIKVLERVNPKAARLEFGRVRLPHLY